MSIPLVCQPKNAPELIHGKLSYVPDLKLWRLSAHLELYDLDLVCYDRGLVALVEGGVEHLYGIGVELV